MTLTRKTDEKPTGQTATDLVVNSRNVPPQHVIESLIVMLRGQRVILDRDLAVLYGVLTGNLNKAVVRNIDRFPPDFMFQLTREELTNLMFQSGISSWWKRGQRPIGTRRPDEAVRGNDKR